jgi:hypothetical protein
LLPKKVASAFSGGQGKDMEDGMPNLFKFTTEIQCLRVLVAEQSAKLAENEAIIAELGMDSSFFTTSCTSETFWTDHLQEESTRPEVPVNQGVVFTVQLK